MLQIIWNAFNMQLERHSDIEGSSTTVWKIIPSLHSTNTGQHDPNHTDSLSNQSPQSSISQSTSDNEKSTEPAAYE